MGMDSRKGWMKRKAISYDSAFYKQKNISEQVEVFARKQKDQMNSLCV